MANPTVDDILSQFKTIQSNKYLVLLPLLSGFSRNPLDVTNLVSNIATIRSNPLSLNVLCDSVILPGRNIATAEYTSGSQSKKAPYTYAEDDVTMSFIETADYKIRNYFDVWLSEIINTQQYTLGYKRDYAKTIVINQLDNAGNISYPLILENAYPTNMAPVEMGNANGDLVKINVTFAYDKYITASDAITSAINGSFRQQASSLINNFGI